MANWDERSKKMLEGVHPDLVKVLDAAYEIEPFKITEGLRSQERQKKLVAKGASKTMKSRHLTGNAIDFIPVNYKGDNVWNDWESFSRIANNIKKSAQDLGVNITWGGDWKTFKDGPHIQINTGKGQPTVVSTTASDVAGVTPQSSINAVNGGQARVLPLNPLPDTPSANVSSVSRNVDKVPARYNRYASPLTPMYRAESAGGRANVNSATDDTGGRYQSDGDESYSVQDVSMQVPEAVNASTMLRQLQHAIAQSPEASKVLQGKVPAAPILLGGRPVIAVPSTRAERDFFESVQSQPYAEDTKNAVIKAYSQLAPAHAELMDKQIFNSDPTDLDNYIRYIVENV